MKTVEFFLANTVRCIDFCENDPKMMCRMAGSCHFSVPVSAETTDLG